MTVSPMAKVSKLVGIVNAAEVFADHGDVIDGCSEMLIEAFNPNRGVGVRVCEGAGTLSGSVSCDVEIRVRPK